MFGPFNYHSLIAGWGYDSPADAVWTFKLPVVLARDSSMLT